MNSAFLLIPLLFIRYGLLSLINKKSLPRAAFFPTMQDIEKTMYWIYQLSTLAMIISMFFLKIDIASIWFVIGLILYIFGTILYVLSTSSFAKPNNIGLNQNGLYRFSRNPMYVAYFIYFLGCVFLTQSFLLFILLIIFQFSSHWIILSEERWCIKNFGNEYLDYMKKVHRYI